MAGGPIHPCSIEFDTDGLCYPGAHVGATNGRRTRGVCVVASLSGDTVTDLEFEMPQVLPSGTAKLRIRALANATTGAAKVNPAWASVAVGDTPDTITLTAEGTTTITWATGDDDELLEALVTLGADTIVADELVKMQVTFETSGWTLAQIACFNFSIIWE